jgi:hypothetical protein
VFVFLTGRTAAAVAGFELDCWIGTALVAVDIFRVGGTDGCEDTLGGFGLMFLNVRDYFA